MLSNFSNKRSISKAILGQLTMDQQSITNVTLWKFRYKDLKFDQFTFWSRISITSVFEDSPVWGILLALAFVWMWPLVFLFGNRWAINDGPYLSRRDSFKLSCLLRKLRKERRDEERTKKNEETLKKMGFDV